MKLIIERVIENPSVKRFPVKSFRNNWRSSLFLFFLLFSGKTLYKQLRCSPYDLSQLVLGLVSTCENITVVILYLTEIPSVNIPRIPNANFSMNI